MKTLILNFHAGIKRWLKEFLQTKKTPLEIAIGFSVGLFVGTLLTPGLNIILALALIAILRINKLATMSGMLITSNPFLIPVIFVTSLKIGLSFTGDKLLEGISIFAVKKFDPIIIQEYLKNLVIGNILLSIINALAGFIIIYFFFKIYYHVKR